MKSSRPFGPAARWLGTALIATLYLALAQLSVLAAAPPASIGAVWLPTGFALACVLVWGARRAGLGVVSGAGIAAAWGAADHGAASALLLMASAGAAVALQSVAAGSLLRRVLRLAQPGLPGRAGAALRAALIVALGCALAAGLGVGVRALVGLAEPGQLGRLWLEWWCADLLGALLVAPPLLALRHWLRRQPASYSSALLALGGGLVISVAVMYGAWALETRRISAEFVAAGHTAGLALQQALDHAEHDLEILSALYSVAPRPTNQDFLRFMAFHERETSAMQQTRVAIWAPYLPGGAAIQSQHSRAASVAAQFVEPLAQNRALVGLDFAANPALRQALERARDTGGPAASAAVTLAPGRGAELLLFWPTYRGAAELRAPTGFVVGVYRARELLAPALSAPELRTMSIELADQGQAGEPLLRFPQGPQGLAPAGAASAEPSDAHYQGSLHFGGRAWRFVARPSPAFFAERRTWIPWLGLAGGLALSALMLLAQLQRQRVGEKIERSNQYFRALIEKSPTAVALVSADGRLSYSSPNYERVMGFPPNSRAGRDAFELVHPDDLEVLRGQFAEIMRDPTTIATSEFRARHHDGSWRWLAGTATNLLTDPAVGAIVVNFSDVSERKRAEQELLNLREAVDTSHEAMFLTDRNGTFSWVNAAFSRLYGYQPEDVLGRATPRILKSGLMRPERYGAFWSTILAGQTVQDEIVNRTKDGRFIHIDRSVSPVLGRQGEIVGFLSIQRDISERKQAEEREERRGAMLELVVYLGKSISHLVDLEQCLRRIHQSIQTGLGFDRVGLFFYDPASDEISGAIGTDRAGAPIDASFYRASGRDSFWRLVFEQPRGMLFTEQYAATFQPPASHTMAGVGQHFALIASVGDLPIALITVDNLVTGRPINDEQVEALQLFAGYVGLAIENARGNARLERHVAERTADLSRANLALTKALSAKDEFLATMSHELRTPLNGILAFAELLEEQAQAPLTERQLRWVQNIDTSGRHLLALINDILDLSKIEAGRFELQPEALQIEAICQSSLLFVKELALKKNLRVTFRCDEPDARMLADPKRLKQILVNLLSNAVKFTPSGGEVCLAVEADRDDGVIRFVVSDTGIGIAEHDLGRLFLPFSQLDAGLARQHEGTGLGLALVRRLAELHGGSVQVASAGVAGQGSAFTVALPWRCPAALAPGASAGEPSEPGALLARGLANRAANGLVLLAEDNETNIQSIADYVEALGYRLVVARNGQEALDIMSVVHPNLVLMDIQMPVLDGLQAIRQLRAQPEYATTPIIALTALAMPGDRERCMQAGASAYVSKPVSLKALAALMQLQLAGQAELVAYSSEQSY